MSRSLHRGAEQDLADAFRFYRREGGSRLAGRFLDEFDRIMKLLDEFPDLGQPTDVDRRSIPLTGFPYSVIYQHVNGEIRVLVVRHQHRDPAHGSERS